MTKKEVHFPSARIIGLARDEWNIYSAFNPNRPTVFLLCLLDACNIVGPDSLKFRLYEQQMNFWDWLMSLCYMKYYTQVNVRVNYQNFLILTTDE